MKFKQWMESKDWYDFERSRGRIHQGQYPNTPSTYASGNAPLVPASDDPKIMAGIYDYDEKSIVGHLKMLHDRMLDATHINAKDLILFKTQMMANIPGDNMSNYSQVKQAWSMGVYGLEKGKFDSFHIENIEKAMKLSHQESKKNTPGGQYFKELFPLIRNIVQKMKSDEFKKVAGERRQDTRDKRAYERQQVVHMN